MPSDFYPRGHQVTNAICAILNVFYWVYWGIWFEEGGGATIDYY